MEKLLIEKIFEKAFTIRKTDKLGAVASTVYSYYQDKYSGAKYIPISQRTIKNYFQQFLSKDFLTQYGIEKSNIRKKITPSLSTLNLLAEFLNFKDFNSFSMQNKSKESLNSDKTSSSVRVNQYGTGSISYGDMTSEGGDITLNIS